jgi:hypothetical protein
MGDNGNMPNPNLGLDGLFPLCEEPRHLFSLPNEGTASWSESIVDQDARKVRIVRTCKMMIF